MKHDHGVTRNGNFFTVKKDRHHHYYIAILIGNARVSAWRRITKTKLETLYDRVEEYDGKGMEL